MPARYFKTHLIGALGFGLAALAVCGATMSDAPPQSKATAMPQDRAVDSYQIYSALLPGNQIEWGNVPRSLWLIEETTIAVQLDKPCAGGGIEMMNPHNLVQAPPARQAEFAEVLADYDAHCHDRYLLDASQFHLGLHVRILDEEEQKLYRSQVSGFRTPNNNIMQAPPTPNEFKGAAGLHSFTAVYFNKAHTLALTEIGMYCGSLCGNWRWVVLELKGGSWQALPWVRGMTIS